MLTVTTWYTWTHPDTEHAWSVSLSKRAPIMVWNKDVGKMVKIARVGVDKDWEQTELKKVNGKYKYIPIEVTDEKDS